jgi:hypothetical protein
MISYFDTNDFLEIWTADDGSTNYDDFTFKKAVSLRKNENLRNDFVYFVRI